jgi:hypothetical protein
MAARNPTHSDDPAPVTRGSDRVSIILNLVRPDQDTQRAGDAG